MFFKHFLMNRTICGAISGEPQLVSDGILFRLAIVELAPAAFHKSPFFVELPRSQVRLSDLQEDDVRTSASGQVEKFSKQTRAQPAAPCGLCDGDVLDFPLFAQPLARDKSPHAGFFLND